MRPAEAQRERDNAAPSDRLLLAAWVADEASEAALRGGMPEGAEGWKLHRGNVRTAIKALGQQPTPRVLLVDVSGVDSPLDALDELAAVCAPDVKVLVLGERSDIAFYRQLTRELGVDEYLYKPLTRDNVGMLLRPRLARALGETHDGPAPSRGGRLVAVAGVRGGAGGTTVAVNLATQLAENTRGHICLLDLNLRGGNAALLLGVQPGAGLRLALEQPERADALFVDRVATPVRERLRVIAAEEGYDCLPAPTEAGVARLLELLQQRFNIVVVDLDLPPGAVERQVLAKARQRVLVMQPEVTQIRDMLAARALLAKLGGEGATITVLNRAGAKGLLAPKLVEQGIGAAPDLALPDLPLEVPKAANLGRPAVLDCAALRRALAPLTQEVSGARMDESAPAAWRRAVAWVMKK